MSDRDRIQALYLNLEMTMNALEQLGEDVKVNDTNDDYSVHGESGRVRWVHSTDRWEVVRP